MDTEGTPPKRGRGAPITMRPIRNAQAEQLLRAGADTCYIAKQLGISSQHMQRILNRMGCRKMWLLPEQLAQLFPQ
jgi:hypothetical protein